MDIPKDGATQRLPKNDWQEWHSAINIQSLDILFLHSHPTRRKTFSNPIPNGNHVTSSIVNWQGMGRRGLRLSTPLSKLLSPVLVFLQSLSIHTRFNGVQAHFEVLKLDRSNLVHRGVKKCLSQVAQRSHGRIFSESCDIGARKACKLVLEPFQGDTNPLVTEGTSCSVLYIPWVTRTRTVISSSDNSCFW
jgi:hypothetical protein